MTDDLGGGALRIFAEPVATAPRWRVVLVLASDGHPIDQRAAPQIDHPLRRIGVHHHQPRCLSNDLSAPVALSPTLRKLRWRAPAHLTRLPEGWGGNSTAKPMHGSG